MKTLITALVIICNLTVGLIAHPQVEHLKAMYKAQGDAMFVPLYWLPETSQILREHIPDKDNWVGFEMGLWAKVTEDQKMLALEDLGVEFERFEEAKLNSTWRRIGDWQQISSQLSLLAGFLDQAEGFLDMAYEDPTLRPAFDWIIEGRNPDFDTKHIGSTFASGELASFYPFLIEYILNTGEKERLECFARLFTQIAKTKQ